MLIPNIRLLDKIKLTLFLKVFDVETFHQDIRKLAIKESWVTTNWNEYEHQWNCILVEADKNCKNCSEKWTVSAMEK